MRRLQTPPAAFALGLVLFLAGCSGETPISPGAGGSGAGSGGGGTCNVAITLAATSVTPFAGTAVVVRATVTRNGVPVPDGTSIAFTTDLGFFNENGLQTLNKVVSNGFADVTPGSFNSGTAHVKASFECATATINLEFQGVPDTTAPFIATISPTTGTCAGGDTITIDGGNFGTDPTAVRVLFGGAPGSVVTVTNVEIKVKTPSRTLANPQVPEQVDVTVAVGAGVAAKSTTKAKAFTYTCLVTRIFISTVVPNAGSPNGGEAVIVNGGNFGTNIATTRVTFCGTPAQITAQTDNAITVSTPRHLPLTNPAGDVCDVAVTIDLGLVSQQAAVLPNAFTYRGSGGGGGCNSDPGFFVASITPNTGPPDGGTVVTVSGGGFGSVPANLRVDFGTNQATITAATPTTITVSVPRHTLANPDVPETVDVTVTDLSSPTGRCARLSGGFQYTRLALQPVIFSTSPRTGPNDASTRVTIFGNNFQFPMQVFLTGGACGTQRIEASIVNPIQLTTIVFQTPIATQGNVCLNNQLVDIEILNPSTGLKASCPGCFKYYSCPTITTADPTFGDYRGVPRVVVNGHNFEEPIAISGAGTPWVPISVSSSSIVATAPQPINIPSCADISGPIIVNSPALSCPNAVGPIFTYIVVALGPVIYSISPTHVSEGGGETVTVTGKNFLVDPNTSLAINFGAGAGGERITPTSMTDTQIVFVAPPFGGTFLTIPCDLGGGVTGKKKIPTPVAVQVTNPTTHCFATINLLYDPNDQTCHSGSPITITTASPLPDGQVGVAYSSIIITASGGLGGPYSFGATGLPLSLTLSTAGLLSGTPDPGTAGVYAVTITASDASGSGSKVLALTINP